MSDHVNMEGGAVWHLDRTVNISVIVAVCVQFAGVIWWGSGVSNRLEAVIAENVQQGTRLGAVETVTNGLSVNAATLAAQLTAVRESLNELKEGTAETNRLLRDLVSRPAQE